jgi:hypothetical protein
LWQFGFSLSVFNYPAKLPQHLVLFFILMRTRGNYAVENDRFIVGLIAPYASLFGQLGFMPCGFVVSPDEYSEARFDCSGKYDGSSQAIPWLLNLTEV